MFKYIFTSIFLLSTLSSIHTNVQNPQLSNFERSFESMTHRRIPQSFIDLVEKNGEPENPPMPIAPNIHKTSVEGETEKVIHPQKPASSVVQNKPSISKKKKKILHKPLSSPVAENKPPESSVTIKSPTPVAANKPKELSIVGGGPIAGNKPLEDNVANRPSILLTAIIPKESATIKNPSESMINDIIPKPVSAGDGKHVHHNHEEHKQQTLKFLDKLKYGVFIVLDILSGLLKTLFSWF